jgi:transcriptional regulator with XRE-family HTH domain
MKFNEKIIRLRKIKGITQDEFAKAVGVSRQAVYKWESGQSYPEVAKLLEIKLLFNVSIDDLLDESFEVALPEKKRKRRLSKAKKEKIEEEVIAAVSAPVTEEAAEEPAPVIAPVEEPAPAAEPAPVETPLTEADEAPEKKKGFFSRIFGRK